ncbi:uncharacterized protein [Palaemon carinicauda]|uniref:uncharacterized protein n=1 Tax=Palaemon carinicauda TaxID=392227 RepID=UPI0035B622D1
MSDETHPDFKSIVDCVTCVDDINEYVGTALHYQQIFEKRTSPWERAEWADDELENFQVLAEHIDRLYHIHHFDDNISGKEYELIARMDYQGRSVYVRMSAGCDYTGFECQGDGEIYVSYDAEVFLKSIITGECNQHGIWKSMIDDGLDVTEPTEFDHQKHWGWNDTPQLQYLCHEAVHANQDQLQYYDEVLPGAISNSVTHHMKVKDTYDHYHNGD